MIAWNRVAPGNSQMDPADSIVSTTMARWASSGLRAILRQAGDSCHGDRTGAWNTRRRCQVRRDEIQVCDSHCLFHPKPRLASCLRRSRAWLGDRSVLLRELTSGPLGSGARGGRDMGAGSRNPPMGGGWLRDRPVREKALSSLSVAASRLRSHEAASALILRN